MVVNSVDENKSDICNKLQNSCDLKNSMISRTEDEDHQFQLGSAEDPSGGRISGGSQESNFTSASDSDDSNQSDQPSSQSSNSLGNQDDSQSLDHEVRIFSSLESNLVPELEEAMIIIDTIRLRFIDSLNLAGRGAQLFDKSDLEELEKPLPPANQSGQSLAVRLISRYLNFQYLLKASSSGISVEAEIATALTSLTELLKFRHRYQIPRTMASDFCQEFFTLDGISLFGHDKQDMPVLYIRARVHRRWPSAFDECFKKYVAWHVDQATKSYREAKIGPPIGLRGLYQDGSFNMCFDCYNVSYSCIDMEFLKFLVLIFVHHYPGYCRSVLLVDLPWLFRSVWKLVKTWLPAESRVQLITSKQLTDYIDVSQIPSNMNRERSSNDRLAPVKPKLPKYPSSIRKFDELGAELGLNSSVIKQFTNHVEKIRKEYEGN